MERRLHPFDATMDEFGRPLATWFGGTLVSARKTDGRAHRFADHVGHRCDVGIRASLRYGDGFEPLIVDIDDPDLGSVRASASLVYLDSDVRVLRLETANRSIYEFADVEYAPIAMQCQVASW